MASTSTVAPELLWAQRSSYVSCVLDVAGSGLAHCRLLVASTLIHDSEFDEDKNIVYLTIVRPLLSALRKLY